MLLKYNFNDEEIININIMKRVSIVVTCMLAYTVFSFAQEGTFNDTYLLKIYARDVNYRYFGLRAHTFLQSSNVPSTVYIPHYGKFGTCFKCQDYVDSVFECGKVHHDIGLDSVVVYYASKIKNCVNLFDVDNYIIDSLYYLKGGLPLAIIKDLYSLNEIVIMYDYRIVIGNIAYYMPSVVVGFLGRNLPISLRDNWEIRYNSDFNRFYIDVEGVIKDRKGLYPTLPITR